MVDGKKTEPENIADQAGLKIALQVSTRMRLKSVAVARPACMRVHHQTFEHLSAKHARGMCADMYSAGLQVPPGARKLGTPRPAGAPCRAPRHLAWCGREWQDFVRLRRGQAVFRFLRTAVVIFFFPRLSLHSLALSGWPSVFSYTDDHLRLCFLQVHQNSKQCWLHSRADRERSPSARSFPHQWCRVPERGFRSGIPMPSGLGHEPSAQVRRVVMAGFKLQEQVAQLGPVRGELRWAYARGNALPGRYRRIPSSGFTLYHTLGPCSPPRFPFPVQGILGNVRPPAFGHRTTPHGVLV